MNSNLVSPQQNFVNWMDVSIAVVGFVPIYGDGLNIYYMGMKALAKSKGFKNAVNSGAYYSSPGWRHCFAEGTKILMGDRSSKNIEDIQVGDTILTYNFTDKRLETKPVLERINSSNSKLIEVVYSNNQVVISTEDHPYFIKGKGWCSYNPELSYQKHGIRTGKMEIADFCFTPKMKRLKKVKVIRITQIEKFTKTYNLSKIANNNYFVNGILVSNENEIK